MSKPREPEKSPYYLSWESMSIRAWWLLKHSETLDPPLVGEDGLGFGIPRLRIWDDAMGFGAESEPFSMTVFHPFDNQVIPLVRRAVWQRKPDLDHLHELVKAAGGVVSSNPTITVQDASVPAAELERRLHAGKELYIPLVWLQDEWAVTTDVGEIGFDFFSLDGPQAKLSLAWSCDKPDAWQPVADWRLELQQFLEECLHN
jgi:hypothetical protein